MNHAFAIAVRIHSKGQLYFGSWSPKAETQAVAKLGNNVSKSSCVKRRRCPQI